MTDKSIGTRVLRRLWTMALGERSWGSRTGDFRTRERYGLVGRPNYAYGMLRAADTARYFGHDQVTIVEFGVASGAGLINMSDLAGLISQETGVSFKIYGFDTGAGLPELRGPKDHPEIWNAGDFTMEDRATLERRLAGRATIIWGDIEQTIGPFVRELNPQVPVGFVSVDVDIYSATMSALKLFDGDVLNYLPAVSMYFDDVGFFFANHWAGELAAINEFNEAHALRKIDRDRSLPSDRRPGGPRSWYGHMYACHLLDHPRRQTSMPRSQLTINAHARFMTENALF